ncbi:MAG: LEA type 2 family protein [Pseudomonadota bacterium]
MRYVRMFAAAALCLLGACSSILPKLEPPQLQVIKVDVLKSDLLQQELRVRMRVDNPNDRVLPVRGITYEMEVAGEPFAHGESDKNFEVPALGSTEFDVSVTANAAGALLKLVSKGGKLDAVEYRMVGKVELASGLIRSVPFEKKGIFKLR